jgi:hypothetical protein
VNRIIALSLGVALIAFSGGCLRSRVDENWGKSYQKQIALQTANPDAPATREPLESLDPETAKRVAERYYEGQEEQSQRQAPDIVIQQ